MGDMNSECLSAAARECSASHLDALQDRPRSGVWWKTRWKLGDMSCAYTGFRYVCSMQQCLENDSEVFNERQWKAMKGNEMQWKAMKGKWTHRIHHISLSSTGLTTGLTNSGKSMFEVQVLKARTGCFWFCEAEALSSKGMTSNFHLLRFTSSRCSRCSSSDLDSNRF